MDLAGLRWSSATARADRFSAESDGVKITGKGSVTGFLHPLFEAEASVPALGTRALVALDGPRGQVRFARDEVDRSRELVLDSHMGSRASLHRDSRGHGDRRRRP